MRLIQIPRITILAVLLEVSGCHSASSAVSRGEHEGLVVEFSATCKDEEVWLNASISNSTTHPINIENGVVPWDYDPVGTFFEATASGRPLEREGGFPPIGRPGPLQLVPQERQSGMLPIFSLFPRMQTMLRTEQPVTVHWAYWKSNETKNGPGRIEGSLQIIGDPCSD